MVVECKTKSKRREIHILKLTTVCLKRRRKPSVSRVYNILEAKKRIKEEREGEGERNKKENTN